MNKVKLFINMILLKIKTFIVQIKHFFLMLNKNSFINIIKKFLINQTFSFEILLFLIN